MSTLQLKVTLRYARPAIWRRIQVDSMLPLSTLHDVLQIAMGWEDCHMHEFAVGERRFGRPSPMDAILGEEHPTLDERGASLRDLAVKPKDAFVYWYDFGDDWMHDVVVEKVLDVDADATRPRCVDGAGACPPEDCGGPFAYAEILKILGNPRHADHAEMKEMFEDIDPAAFDADATDRALARAFGGKAKPKAKAKPKSEPKATPARGKAATKPRKQTKS